uniref:Uncharacterized protein n=1 Tax=Nelumbo nucifera TaxID=4432 RepID=A0A822XU65_NELNU|nr:TPA_asm: hypothetical protein HUJ06_024746 [Nelumbo nucifera]
MGQIIPHHYGFSCTDDSDSAQGIRESLLTLCWQGNQSKNSSSEIILLPVPYELPPQPYSSEDVPWSWDKQY